MGQLLSLRALGDGRGREDPGIPRRPREDRASAARGILLALAMSCLFWVGLALGVPRLW